MRARRDSNQQDICLGITVSVSSESRITMGRIDKDCDSCWLGLDQQIELRHRTLWQCTSATGQPLFPSDYRTNPACDAFSGQVLQTKLNLPVTPAPFCHLRALSAHFWVIVCCYAKP